MVLGCSRFHHVISWSGLGRASRLVMIELTEYVPPFFKTNGPIIIGIHFGKEFVEVAIGNSKSGSPQSRAQLIFGDPAVAIVVDGLE